MCSRGALASGDALVCLSFHDEVVGFAEAASLGGLNPRAREGGDDSGYDDSGDDEAEEEEEVEGGVGGDKSAFEAT